MKLLIDTFYGNNSDLLLGLFASIRTPASEVASLPKAK
jgi:hypothetical protein